MSSANRMIKKYLLCCFLGVASFCLCAQLSAKAEESTLTADIIKYTRYQTDFVSSSSDSSETAKQNNNIGLKDIAYTVDWYRNTLDNINDIIMNSGTVDSAYIPPSISRKIYTGKTFIEYPNGKNETATIYIYSSSGNVPLTSDYAYKVFDFDLLPNQVLIHRSYNDGTSHNIVFQPVSGVLNLLEYESGVRLDSNVSYNVIVSDNTLTQNPNTLNYFFLTNSTKNTTNQELYNYDYDNYDYILSTHQDEMVDYPTDNMFLHNIYIIYKYKSQENFNFNAFNTRNIHTFYISALSSTLDKSHYTTSQYFTTIQNLVGATPPIYTFPTYNTNIFDLPEISVNPDLTYSIDFPTLENRLKLDLPDFDIELKDKFSMQPTINANFTLNPDVTINYNNTFNDVNLPDLPDDSGGGTVWQPPKYPPLNSTPIITTRSSVELVEVTFPTSVLSNGGTILESGLDGLTDCMPELVSVALVCMVFGFLWKFTGG